MAFTLKKAVSAVVGAISGTPAPAPTPAPTPAPPPPAPAPVAVGKKINFKPGPKPIADIIDKEVVPGKNWPFPKMVMPAATPAPTPAPKPAQAPVAAPAGPKKIVVVKGGGVPVQAAPAPQAAVSSETLASAGLEAPADLDAKEFFTLPDGSTCWIRNPPHIWVVKHYMPGDKVKVTRVYPLNYGPLQQEQPYKMRGYTVEVLEPRERRGNKAFVFRHELVLQEPNAGTYTSTKVQKLDTQPALKAEA